CRVRDPTYADRLAAQRLSGLAHLSGTHSRRVSSTTLARHCTVYRNSAERDCGNPALALAEVFYKICSEDVTWNDCGAGDGGSRDGRTHRGVHALQVRVRAGTAI